MFRGVTDLIQVLGQFVPTPVLVGILVVLALVALPSWLRSVRVRQVKGHLRTAARAYDEHARQQAVDAAFERAGDRPQVLVALAEQAIRNGQPLVCRRALDALEATGKLELDLMRLRKKVGAAPPRRRDPLEAVVRVERLHDLGLGVAAREALDAALEMHPEDPELLGLQARLFAEDPGADDSRQARRLP